ncbi:MAG TPA: type VI secretion system tip protein VgrG [Gammaproteobacteria bacterium]|nr:type VI secretion system tip protein VgrG [Gammaproteobacteria bacterium]
MSALTQNGKSMAIKTSLGRDELLLISFSGSESISSPFDFCLEMLSANHNITAREIVGQAVDVKLLLSDGTFRYFNGYIMQWFAGPVQANGYRLYRARMVPWLRLLTLNADCRIFQDTDVTSILEDVFNSRGYSDFSIASNRSFRTREYTVQYRETDFQFVSRLMEEEGLFYFFVHESGKHTMHIADSASRYVDCMETEASYFDGGRVGDQLTDWVNQYNLIPGKWAQTDYNFETPGTDISTSIDTVVDLPGINAFEQYDYPGLYEDRSAGDGLTKVRIEEEETTYNIVSAAGTYRSFTAGGKFTLTYHEVAEEQGKQYVISQISHEARENSYDLGQRGGNEYSNKFQCIPASVAFRPRRQTPQPSVQGPQTALVVGPAGEEIHTDEFGRIKVQFYWDRVGKKNENSSCWLRVAQQWAGKNWGAIYIPRIGHEVVVSFLDGNPDRPLVTGCVYNAENRPPYDLPANKTQSGWKTRSSKNGGSANFNELRFEDKKGSEEIYIHAEKDQNNVVENDETTEVGHDRSENIGNNETIAIGNDRTEDVGNNETINIGNDRKENVAKNETISIGGNRTETVSKNEKIDIAGRQTITIDKEKSESVKKSLALSVGEDRGTEIGKSDSLSVGKKLTIEAGDEITLKTGKAQIVMKKNGDISIQGKNLILKGSGKITAKASSDIILKGSKIAQN